MERPERPKGVKNHGFLMHRERLRIASSDSDSDIESDVTPPVVQRMQNNARRARSSIVLHPPNESLNISQSSNNVEPLGPGVSNVESYPVMPVRHLRNHSSGDPQAIYPVPKEENWRQRMYVQRKRQSSLVSLADAYDRRTYANRIGCSRSRYPSPHASSSSWEPKRVCIGSSRCYPSSSGSSQGLLSEPHSTNPGGSNQQQQMEHMNVDVDSTTTRNLRYRVPNSPFMGNSGGDFSTRTSSHILRALDEIRLQTPAWLHSDAVSDSTAYNSGEFLQHLQNALQQRSSNMENPAVVPPLRRACAVRPVTDVSPMDDSDQERLNGEQYAIEIDDGDDNYGNNPQSDGRDDVVLLHHNDVDTHSDNQGDILNISSNNGDNNSNNIDDDDDDIENITAVEPITVTGDLSDEDNFNAALDVLSEFDPDDVVDEEEEEDEANNNARTENVVCDSDQNNEPDPADDNRPTSAANTNSNNDIVIISMTTNSQRQTDGNGPTSDGTVTVSTSANSSRDNLPASQNVQASENSQQVEVEEVVNENNGGATNGASTSQQSDEQISDVASYLQGFHSKLVSLLECPVCMETIVPPIIQCKQGHPVCSLCRPRLTFCPTCRTRFSENRNLLMEKVAEIMLFPCKNSLLGCIVSVQLRDKTDHELSCSFRQYECVHSTCSWHGFKQELVVHVTTDHPRKVITCNDKKFKINPYATHNVNFVLTAFDEVFVITFIHINGSLLGNVIYLGDFENAVNYKYRIYSFGNGLHLSYSGPTVPDKGNRTYVCKEGFAFPTAQRFFKVNVSGGTIEMVVNVYKANEMPRILNDLHE